MADMGRIGMIIYLVIGVLVAAARGYIGDIDGLGGLVNLLLAILLWPLVLLGVKFNLGFGGGDGKNRGLGLLFGPPMIYLVTLKDRLTPSRDFAPDTPIDR